MPTPFKLASRELPIILVKANVAGEAKARDVVAMIDTGATGCVASPRLAKELAMKKVKVQPKEKSAQGIGGKVKVDFVQASRIECDGAVATNIKVAVMDLSVIQKSIKTKRQKAVEMILGYSFFKGRTLVIDYKNKTISVTQSDVELGRVAPSG
ncbi:MAG: retropepsin-like domain-containing protein [Chloroherpetonaceae bacterium]|nr:retropepsin-like domain-containing protein [Chloroherpetonaceae bacterium]MDW8437637.1 retropepsin-like aspartic protease [Chloroherpetonaceae bacterium]